MAVKEFVDRFHSLSGKTIGEKLKNLNQLISNVKSKCSGHEIDQFIAEVKPRNNFEKLLKGRLIDSFKKSQVLLDVLRCEDRLLIKQVLGCDWFFEGCSADFPSCEYFITEVFPNTSFNTRNDIIHLLSVHLRDKSVAERFFTVIRNEYGLKQAKPLLCACSVHFIQSVLDADDARLHFTQREVSSLVRKYPELVKANIKKTCFAAYLSEILELMLDVDVKVFIELFETLDCYVHPNIGRRGCKKIIRCNPAAVIKSAQKYLKVLKVKYLHKYLNIENFGNFYVALFPTSFRDSGFFEDSGDFYSVVEILPREKRLEMLLSYFEKVYGETLLAQTDLVREKLLLLLPPDKRDMCAQQKIDNCVARDEDETCWICYLTTDKSVPMLKKLLVEAPDLDSRSKLIAYLILTCKINENLEALASVCKYVVSRYRNDTFSLRSRILSELTENFDLLKFDDRHWSSIHEAVKIVFLNNEHENRSWLISDILAKSVHYKLNTQADICEQIDQLIIIKSSSYYCWDNWVIIKEQPKYQQIIFEAFAERIPGVKKISSPLTTVALSLLKSVSSWNKDNKEFQSSLCKFPWAVESLKEIVDKNLEGGKKDVLNYLQNDLETKQLVCPEHVYEEEVQVAEVHVNKDVKYFLKMETEKFIQNAREELQFLLEEKIELYKHLFRTWNLQSFTRVKEVVVQNCISFVENDQHTQGQENAIFVLSFLMESESFLQFIKPFHPVADKIDLSEEKTEEMLPLIKMCAMCLKNVNTWSDYNSVAAFCKGDYLKYVLGSLFSVCYNTSQNKIVPFLEVLTNSPVSVKKHAVRLSFSIVSKPQLLPLLSRLWNTDKNPATREVLLALVWKAFSEPTPDRFTLLKYCLKSLRVDDKNMFDKLSVETDIPDDYKAEYMELCWDKLHDLLLQGAKTKPFISELVCRFEYVVQLLPSSFCDRVLKQHLCDGSPYKKKCIKFAVKYILKLESESVLNERFSIVSNLLKALVRHSTEGWNDIILFVKILCSQILLNDNIMVQQVLQKCLGVWSSVFKPFQKFDIFLHLKFISLYFSCTSNFNLVCFAKLSYEYICSLVEECGPEVVTDLSKAFNRCMNFVGTSYESRLSVINYLLTEPVSKHAYIMAAHLVPTNLDNDTPVRDGYIHVMKLLFSVEDKAVCLILNSLPAFDK